MQTESTIVTEARRFKRAAPAKKAPPLVRAFAVSAEIAHAGQIQDIFSCLASHYLASLASLTEKSEHGQLGHLAAAEHALQLSRKYEKARRMLESAIDNAGRYLDEK